MAIYLYIPGIPGSTSAKGYEQWIPILAMDWGAGRVIETASGNVADRICSNTSGVEMEIIKQMDQSFSFAVRTSMGRESNSRSPNSRLLCGRYHLYPICNIL